MLYAFERARSTSTNLNDGESCTYSCNATLYSIAT